ncbi:DUF3147 family protein [Sulfuriroseicoccus oceanibius]|nr:DUF3147 family protein [Sulfuriroseicoccus oceanibius]
MLVAVKILTSAVLIYIVNEIVVKHSKPLVGSLIASLPLVSLLTFFWIYFDLRAKPDEAIEKLASHSVGVFWFVIPSLPAFLLIPYLLKKGIGFWPSMVAGCVLTVTLYYVMSRILARFGMVM